MKQYAEITDKGECYSSLSLCIEGVNANATEWSKHNFYPQNGMVGEIVEIYNPYTYILKIQDTIYVPISPKGFKKISETEFNRRVSNNSYTGMDAKQQRINRDYNNTISRPYSLGKPNYKDTFWHDIVNNITIRTDNYTKPMFMPQLIDECVMYACDICLEFKKKAGTLPNDWLKHISSQVCDVFDEHFEEFTDYERDDCMNRIERIINSSSAELMVDIYYKR